MISGRIRGSNYCARASEVNFIYPSKPQNVRDWLTDEANGEILRLETMYIYEELVFFLLLVCRLHGILFTAKVFFLLVKKIWKILGTSVNENEEKKILR